MNGLRLVLTAVALLVLTLLPRANVFAESADLESRQDLIDRMLSAAESDEPKPLIALLQDEDTDDSVDLAEELPKPPISDSEEEQEQEEDEDQSEEDTLDDEDADEDSDDSDGDDEYTDDYEDFEEDYGEDDDDPSFPALPPDPNEDDKLALGDLDLELWGHGGSYLYQPEGDRLGWPSDEHAHFEYLRLPEDWCAPEPVTAFTDFLGADPVKHGSKTWKGPGEYSWEPRFVGYGSYELFGFAFEQDGVRSDAIGNQLLLDLDLRLTGTERFHVQFRPLGRRNTGGSFYDFADNTYIDNATAEPDRYWFEGDIHSILGWGSDRNASRNINFLIGKFPLLLHNSLLMNDDILGFAVSQNNIQLLNASNLNVQGFAAFNDVDSFAFVESDVYGVHGSLDFKRVFYEATYAFVNSDFNRDAHYAGFSRTKFYGPRSIAARGLFKWGDRTGTGSGQLVTIESNRTRVFDHAPLGIEHGVFFFNALWASSGWNSIAGGNLNRLRTAFEVDPLVRLAAGPARQDTVGLAIGVQLFRHHEDESFVPEFAWESPGGETVFGLGFRYQKKLNSRSFVEVSGLKNWSDDDAFEREGIFVARRWLF